MLVATIEALSQRATQFNRIDGVQIIDKVLDIFLDGVLKVFKYTLIVYDSLFFTDQLSFLEIGTRLKTLAVFQRRLSLRKRFRVERWSRNRFS